MVSVHRGVDQGELTHFSMREVCKLDRQPPSMPQFLSWATVRLHSPEVRGALAASIPSFQLESAPKYGKAPEIGDVSGPNW